MVKTDEFALFCLDTYSFFNEMFPWMHVSQSVHRYLAHNADIIAQNGDQGLAQLSESPLESSHKVLRRVRINLTRMTGLGPNLQDTFGRLWMHSSPQIRHQKPPKKIYVKKKSDNDLDDELFKYFIQSIDNEPE